MNGHELLKESGLLAKYKIDERVIPTRKQRRAVLRYLDLLERQVNVGALQKKALGQLAVVDPTNEQRIKRMLCMA